jgi:EmrB/QacA subfamily drug resistance transporter
MERKWTVFCVVVFGVFVSVVDNSASVVAMPTLAFAFGTDLPTVQWVTVGNGLTIAALLVPMGRLGDLIGRKLVYVSGFLVFVAGSLLAAMAQEVSVLTAARVVAGVGAAMAQGNSVAIIAAAFEDHERGRVLGLQMGVVGVGAIVGPALGGLIIGLAGWRYMFVVVAVAGVLVAVIGQGVLRRRKSRPVAEALRFDWLGAALSALFLVALLLTLASGARVGWDSPRLHLGIVASVVLLALFVWREHRASRPMLELSLFRNPVFTLGVIGTMATFMGLAAMRYLVPFHVQAVLALDVTWTGLVLVPAAIVTAVASPVTGRLSDRMGARRFANLGLAICVIGLIALSRLGPDVAIGYLIGAMMLTSFGAAAFHAPNTSSVINSVDRRHYGVVSGFTNLARNAGNVIGVALATTVVSIVMASRGHPPSLSAGLDPAIGARQASAGVLSSFDGGARLSFLLLALIVAITCVLSIRFASVMPRRSPAPAAAGDATRD